MMPVGMWMGLYGHVWGGGMEGLWGVSAEGGGY